MSIESYHAALPPEVDEGVWERLAIDGPGNDMFAIYFCGWQQQEVVCGGTKEGAREISMLTAGHERGDAKMVRVPGCNAR